MAACTRGARPSTCQLACLRAVALHVPHILIRLLVHSQHDCMHRPQIPLNAAPQAQHVAPNASRVPPASRGERAAVAAAVAAHGPRTHRFRTLR